MWEWPPVKIDGYRNKALLVWANYNSLTWIVGPFWDDSSCWPWFQGSGERWGRYNLPRLVASSVLSPEKSSPLLILYPDVCWLNHHLKPFRRLVESKISNNYPMISHVFAGLVVHFKALLVEPPPLYARSCPGLRCLQWWWYWFAVLGQFNPLITKGIFFN